ncbi:MAG TPA: cell division protein FtsL [bacterium]|nr:cell division protein FtsL [bacterium]
MKPALVFIALGLWLGSLASAVAVVYAEHLERKYVFAVEKAVQHHDELEIERERLQLEEASLASHGRVDSMARSRLQMVAPSAGNITLVRLP